MWASNLLGRLIYSNQSEWQRTCNTHWHHPQLDVSRVLVGALIACETDIHACTPKELLKLLPMLLLVANMHDPENEEIQQQSANCSTGTSRNHTADPAGRAWQTPSA